MAGRKMHADEVEIGPELVRRLVAGQFPVWQGLPIERVPSTGTVNALYRLGDELVIRLPIIHGWADDLLKEVQWLPELAPALPLAVPTPIATGSPAHGYPFNWAVYRWLPGQPLSEAGQLDLGQVGRALVEFISALTEISVDGAPRSRRDRPLAARDAEVAAAVTAIGEAIDATSVTAAWEASVAAATWNGHPVWTHGDLLTPNLLADRGRLSAVIDFGNMGAGDPAVDLIPAWTVLSGDQRETFRSALPHDTDTWVRARGMALHQALMIIPYYSQTNPDFVATAKKTIDNVLADHDSS